MQALSLADADQLLYIRWVVGPIFSINSSDLVRPTREPTYSPRALGVSGAVHFAQRLEAQLH